MSVCTAYEYLCYLQEKAYLVVREINYWVFQEKQPENYLPILYRTTIMKYISKEIFIYLYHFCLFYSQVSNIQVIYRSYCKIEPRALHFIAF